MAIKLTQKDLLRGDHILVRRLLHSHHGIYLGNGMVVHFKGTSKEKSNPIIRETGLSEFLLGGTLRRREYKVRLPREETVRMARDLLDQGDYSLVTNNCEHLATYCVTGKPVSRQVRRGALGLMGALIVVVGTFVLGSRGEKRK